MAATISDVARKAGVSMKTVSRVVNNESGVSQATRAAVLNIINELGYVPNVSARRLASDRAFVIALVITNNISEYHSSIMDCFLDAMKDGRYALQLVFHNPELHESRDAMNRVILQKSVDGLVFTPPCDNDPVLLHMCSSAHIPFVRLTPMGLNLPYPYVAGNDRQGAYDLTQYIIRLGHRQIAFLMGERQHEASQARLEGFLAAMQDNRLPVRHDLIRDGDFSFDIGRAAAHALFKETCCPTAIIASNDESAVGALYAAHEAGLSVPEQISIAGIDDIPMARKVWPALTTVRQPLDLISRLAANLIIDLVEGRTPQQTQIRVEEDLIIRQTTAPCPQ